VGDSIKIRKAQLHDLKPMAKLLGELFAIEDDFIFDLECHTKALTLLSYSKDATLYVAKSKNRVVGMVSMQSYISTAMGGYVGLIEDMIVTSEFRGRGIGTQLLTALIVESNALGYARLSLAADRRNNAALSFYQTFGFEVSNMGLMYYLPRAP
jgi:ribosomal protein S18 acetylase RimI-like enzyme